ncbi:MULTISPECIES: helix-turn-helix transcriptional regulator [Vibrio]|uniref:helix-turn-helix transcriptional regulator n=1 Tax=Vibrio TaxID=662 RepID=UPI000CE985DC|nr:MULTISPECIES: AlpA family phage regulatory protein [Vibrio]MDF4384633.1 AlpA family phage regulatory protein [Vibrio parahaemolyticus]AVF93976.1 transcriptional regulator [Vibrio diabolicus]MCR9641873.1 AlpA family transcriptional regulator [Vibrio alginolyticus]MDW2055595.1 AlpA family phage regulatory protein [Vibrio sp. 506]MDW2096993.1 AlpA family phage regulatory protein [Vibrio sp. 1751]
MITSSNLTAGFDRIIREEERKALTSISRTQAWRLEKRGLFPKRVKLCGSHSVGWRLSEIMNWIESRGADHE